MDADARDASSRSAEPASSAFVWPSEVARTRGDESGAGETRTTSTADQSASLDAPGGASPDFPVESAAAWELATTPPQGLHEAAAARLASATPTEPRRVHSHTIVRSAVAALAAIAVVQAAIIAFLLTSGSRSSDPLPAFIPATAETDVGTAGPSVLGEVQPAALIAPLLAPVKAVRSAPETPARPQPELQVRTDPPGARLVIDGKPRGVTPVSVGGLAPGRHRVRLSTPDGWLERAVTIKSAAPTTLFVPLPRPKRLRAPGWVFVVAPIPVDVFAGGRRLGNTAQGRVPLASGDHQLQLVNEALGFRGTVRATVAPGEVTRVRPNIPDGVVSLDASPTAQVWIDGRYLGETPLAEVRVPLGRREIRFSHPELGEQVRRVMVGAREPTRVNVDLRQ